MSTQIAEIEGIEEGPLVLTQFGLANHKGLGLSIFVHNTCRDGWMNFNKKQVQQLVKELQNWLGETELPFETVWSNHDKRRNAGNAG